MAEMQTHGRGRLNRSWYSPFGKNIYFSCRYSFQKDLCELSGLSLVTGLAILRSVGDFGISADLTVQWPNHIMWRQKKLAGCLIEVYAEAHGNCHAIISIGINVNSLHADADFPGASMAQALGKSLDRNDVCVLLIQHLLDYLRRFESSGFSTFRQEWLQNDCLINQPVLISNHQRQIKGHAIDINDQGYLLLQLPDQSIQICTAGDSALLK